MNARSTATLAAIAFALSSCQLVAGSGRIMPPAGFTLEPAPEALTQSRMYDWTFNRISGSQIARARKDAVPERQLMAYPNATSWTGGVDLTALGCASGDSMPNGAAAIFLLGGSSDALSNMMVMVTKNGRLIKVNRFDQTKYTTINLGKTFSKTYVTLGPEAKRIYVVSDDGTLFVVEPTGMTIKHQVSLGANAYGCAPVFDPFLSSSTGSSDLVYVPDNAGYVNKYTVTHSGISAKTAYPVSNGITALAAGDNTRKIKAPAIVMNGVIYVGDQAGRLMVYDTANTANNIIYNLASPVNTPPAIEIQDGTYSMTDATGAAKTVAANTPVYAFVTAGVNCFWANLHSQTLTRSAPLYIDDNQPTKLYGKLLEYTYDPGVGTSVPMTLAHWAAIRTDNETALAGATAGSNKTSAYIGAGEVDAVDGDGTYAGGPVICYLRFSTGTTTTSVVKKATLQLSVTSSYRTRVPEFRACSSYLVGTSTLWTFANITNANRPSYGTDNDGVFQGATDLNGFTSLNSSTPGTWDISAAFRGGAASDYSMVMMYNAGNKVLWEEGDKNKTGGGTPGASDYTDGCQYRSPSDGAVDKRPVFTISGSTGSFPTPSIETPAAIDPFSKKCYVFYGNAMYEMDWSSTANFQDANAASYKTLFNMSYLGRSSTSGVTNDAGGASHATKTRYVSNFTTPIFNYDMSAAYVLDRYPTTPTETSPTSYKYCLSKMTLPLSATADRLVSSTPPEIAGVSGDASSVMTIDPFSDVFTTGGNVFFGLGDGKVYQFDK